MPPSDGTNGGAGGHDGDGAGSGSCATAPACKRVPLPENAHALRLTHEQWENSVRDLLRLPSAPGLSAAFPKDPVAPPDKYARDAGSLIVSSELWREYQRAAEALAALVTDDASQLDKILPAAAKDGQGDVATRFRAFAADFLRRAYRRPPIASELADAAALGDAIAASETSADPFVVRVKWLVAEALQSPFFLHRVEAGEDAAAGGRARLGPYELASRLSYALWRTMPDDALLDRAARGKLTTAADAADVARTMLRDPRARASLLAFHEALFGVDNYQGIVRQTKVYPQYYPQVGADAQEDLRRTVAALVVDGDGGLAQLYTSDKVFVNARLAPLYGLDATGLAEDAFVERKLDASKRAGILAHVGWLAWEGHAKDPASIQRGAFMARHVLCLPLGSPPPAAKGKDPSMFPEKTNRARIEEMTHECGAGCHTTIINPLGFGFEKFDALGMFRTADNGVAVDATGTNVELGKFDGVPQMMQAVAESPRAHACYAAHWAAYLTGLASVDVQSDWLGPILARSKKGASVRDLIVDLVQTDLFLTVSRAP